MVMAGWYFMHILLLVTDNNPLKDSVEGRKMTVETKSTAMVMAGWYVHLTTLFPGQA